MILDGLGAGQTWDAVEPALGMRLADPDFEAALRAIADFEDLKSPYTLGHAAAVRRWSPSPLNAGLGDGEVVALRRAAWPMAAAGSTSRTPFGTSTVPLEPVRARPSGCTHISTRECSIGRLRSPRSDRSLRSSASGSTARVFPRAGRRRGGSGAGRRGRLVARCREGPAGLTARQVDVLRLVPRGLPPKDRDPTRHLAEDRRNHIERICAKIDVSNRACAGLFTMQHASPTRSTVPPEPEQSGAIAP